jgi:DNA polymerase III subunit beta
MRLTCDSADLAAALAVVMRAAASRTSLPVLGMVLLQTTAEGELRLTATNLELAIRRTIPAAVAEEGAVAVPGRLLADFTGAMPREELRLALEETGRLVLRSESFSTEINGVPGDEFPPVSTGEVGDRLALPAPLLVGAVADTLVAASGDEARPVLTGVRLETGDGRLTLLASDGHRLAVRGVELGASPALAAGGVTVPARALAEAVRLFRALDGDVEMAVSATGNQVVLRAPGIELASRVIDGAYPDLMRLVPDAPDTRVIIPAADLAARLRALAPFAETSANVVRLDVAPRSILLTATTVDVGSARTELAAEVAGPETSVAFNARYLLDCPALASDERVELHLQGPLGAFVVRRVARDDYVYLFMPVRYSLRAEQRAASLT